MYALVPPGVIATFVADSSPAARVGTSTVASRFPFLSYTAIAARPCSAW